MLIPSVYMLHNVEHSHSEVNKLLLEYSEFFLTLKSCYNATTEKVYQTTN